MTIHDSRRTPHPATYLAPQTGQMPDRHRFAINAAMMTAQQSARRQMPKRDTGLVSLLDGFADPSYVAPEYNPNTQLVLDRGGRVVGFRSAAGRLVEKPGQRDHMMAAIEMTRPQQAQTTPKPVFLSIEERRERDARMAKASRPKFH